MGIILRAAQGGSGMGDFYNCWDRGGYDYWESATVVFHRLKDEAVVFADVVIFLLAVELVLPA